MTWMDRFDLARHVVEILFYLVIGPLGTVFAVKQIARQRRLDQQMLELQRQLAAIAGEAGNRRIVGVVMLLDDASTAGTVKISTGANSGALPVDIDTEK